jgi:tetratricopeptide (TPR) repeat protein/tRNA A-37 threonylcarbamoyl transferase component Bud32
MLALGLVAESEAATSPYSPAPGFTPLAPEELNRLFPLIEIFELIGQGGMGAVYRGRQKNLDRQVAIKILPPEIGRDAAFAERFTREARALARLSHRNIVAVYDAGQVGDFFYFVMEYVDGTNLRELIRGDLIEPRQALAIVQQVCDALAYAHSIGIVHRDIKPENILVDGAGTVKIADFGLAKLVGVEAPNVSLTDSEQIMGTWRYMAPEQLEGARDIDHRADIYSLGVVFYELLTGEVPMGRFRPPSEKVEIDVRVDEVVLKSLERERERRYQHASQVKSEVDAISRASIARAGGSPPRASIPHRMTAAIAAVVGAISIAVGLAFLAAAAYSQRETWQFWVYLSGAVLIGSTGAWLIRGSYRQIGRGSLPEADAAVHRRPVTAAILLATAFAMVGGFILFGVGIALMPAAFRLAVPGTGYFWAWMGGALGCFFVGVASLVASWTYYRRLSGQIDWTKVAGWSAFDRALVLYGMLGVGIALVCCTLAWTSVFGPLHAARAKAVVEASLLLGITMLLQAALGLLMRAPYFLISPSEAGRVAAPPAPDRVRHSLRYVLTMFLIGGIAMTLTLIALAGGWMILAYQPAPTISSAAGLSEEQRIEQAESLTMEGWQLWRQRKFAEAAPKFEQAVALDPQAANAWNGLGWANFNGGRSDEAVRAFEKAVELEPDHPAALNGLGQAYYAAGDLTKAEKYLSKAAPQASAAAYGLGRLYLLTGKYAEAEKWLQKATGDSPNDPLLQQMLQAARSKQLPDDLRRQIAPVGKSEALSPAAARGWQQFNEGKLRSAELAFRRALAKNPEEASALNGLGFCLLTSGKWAEAKRYFEKCLAVDPDAAGAMNGLARCLKAEGKVDEAIAKWEEMRKKFPGPNAAAVGLATTYLERGEYAKALPLYEELAAASPDDPQFRQGLEAARKGVETNKQ